MSIDIDSCRHIVDVSIMSMPLENEAKVDNCALCYRMKSPTWSFKAPQMLKTFRQAIRIPHLQMIVPSFSTGISDTYHTSLIVNDHRILGWCFIFFPKLSIIVPYTYFTCSLKFHQKVHAFPDLFHIFFQMFSILPRFFIFFPHFFHIFFHDFPPTPPAAQAPALRRRAPQLAAGAERAELADGAEGAERLGLAAEPGPRPLNKVGTWRLIPSPRKGYSLG